MQIIRSKRRTLALVVGPDGSLTVRAPLRLPQATIDAFIRDKSAWIEQKQAEARQRSERCGRPAGVPHRFASGEMFLYLGDAYPLELVAHGVEALVFDGYFKLKETAQPRAAQLFETWYKTQARDLFSGRLAALSEQTGLHYQTLRLSSAKTRWGSCSSRGTISLNWKLIMAPPAVIDYVVIHELAHIREKNHSKRYWALVESLLPGYRPLRGWLKTNGICLAWP